MDGLSRVLTVVALIGTLIIESIISFYKYDKTYKFP